MWRPRQIGAVVWLFAPARLLQNHAPMLARLFLLSLVFALPSVGVSAQTVADIAARRRCSTAGVEGLSAQLSEAQACIRPGAFVRFAPHPNITLTSNRVHPFAQASAVQAIHRAAERRSLTINSAYRTVADQYVLFRGGACAAAASPGRSNHQGGRAIDVQNYSSARSVLESEGCAWLGAGDPVHFDCPGSDQRSDSVLAFQRLWNLNHPEDPIAEDSDYGPQTDARLRQSPAGGFPIDLCDGGTPVDPPDDPPATSGGIRGVVYVEGDLDDRISNATVRVIDTGATTSTSDSGAFAFDVPAGSYTVEATAPGFGTGRVGCSVSSGDSWCSIGLRAGSEPAADGVAAGFLYADDGADTPIAGGRVLVEETGLSAVSATDGAYEITLTEGEYTLVASAERFATVRRRCQVNAGARARCVLRLPTEENATTVFGVVTANSDPNARVVGARVRVLETEAETRSREGDGRFSFVVSPGTYTLEVSGEGFDTAMRSCEVTEGENWCSVNVFTNGEGDVDVEQNDEGQDHDTDAPPSDLEESRRGSIEAGCRSGGTPGWMLVLLAALVGAQFRRRRT
ncbi:MAG: carboxypeptidase regulatory-like domain-containing protein [Myxococcota bacterium]